MFILFGIISSVFMMLLELLLLQIPFSLHEFKLWLVFPVGGIFDGFLCSMGVYLYLKIRHISLKPKHLICGVLIAFAGFWAINYMSYISAYVNNGLINHSFTGTHISKYMYNNSDEFNFINYMNFLFKNHTVTTYLYSGVILSKDNLGSGFYKFTFLLEGICFCVGGLASGIFAMDGRDYCKCKNDFISKLLFCFNPEILDDEIGEIKKSFISKNEFMKFVQSHRNTQKDDTPIIQVFQKHCPSCKIAFIEYRYMELKSKKGDTFKWKENKDKSREIDAPYLVV